MTVNELISELNKIEDKDRSVKVYADMHDLPVKGIHLCDYDHSIRLDLQHVQVDWGDF